MQSSQGRVIINILQHTLSPFVNLLLLLRTSDRIAYWAREVLAVFIKDVWTMDRFGFLKMFSCIQNLCESSFSLNFELLVSIEMPI